MRTLLVIRKAEKLKMKSRSVLQVIKTTKKGGKLIKEIGIRDIEAVLILGREIYIESSVLSVLSTMNIPIAVIAKDSVGIVMNPVIITYNNYRRLQYNLPKEEQLEIALEYIKAKLKGMNNILFYHRRKRIKLEPLPKFNGDIEDYERQIRAWESVHSAKLWRELVKLLPDDILEELRKKYGFSGRTPKHKDPFNKTLSVMYAILYSLATKALISAGLDPTYGFLHKTRYSTPLTFDYTEMFKPVAIHATIQLIARQGLPELNKYGELDVEDINKAIKGLYEHLTLRHKDTKRSLYQLIYLKAFRLTHYLEHKCRKELLAVIYNRHTYRKIREKLRAAPHSS